MTPSQYRNFLYNQDDVLILASVACACKGSHPFNSLRHVVYAINGFISFHPWTVENACIQGYPRLARFLLSRPTVRDIDWCYLAHLCNRGADRAATEGRLSVIVDFTRYFPSLVLVKTAAIGAGAGHLHVIAWLMNHPQTHWDENALIQATRRGHTRVVHRLADFVPGPRTPDLLYCAVTRGHDSLSQWWWVHFATIENVDALETAISLASLPTAKWMMTHNMFPLQLSLEHAATRGDLEWLQWASAYRVKSTANAINSAALHGHLHVVQWLAISRPEMPTHRTMSLAAKGGHLHILDWLYRSKRLDWRADAIFNSAVFGHVDTLAWLLRHGSIIPPLSTFDEAASAGHMKVLHLLGQHQFVRATTIAMDMAAANGHLKVVKWLHYNRTEGCTTNAMDQAARNGHLDVIQWLHNNRREGCTSRAIDLAARHGHFEVAHWLYFQRVGGFTQQGINNAAQSGSLRMIKLFHLIAPGRFTNQTFDAALSSGNLELCEWLLSNFLLSSSQRGVDATIRAGHFELLANLCFHIPTPCSYTAFEIALTSRNLYLAAWAYRRCVEPKDIQTVKSLCALQGINKTISDKLFG